LRRDLTRGQRAELRSLETLLRELRLVYAEGYTRLRERAFQGLESLAALEAEFATGSLAAAIDDLEGVSGSAAASLRAAGAAGILTPTADQLAAVINSRPAQGKLLAAWFEDMEASHVARIEQALRLGFVEGETIPQMQARLAGVWTLNRRGAEAVIRTSITHMSAEVAQLSYEANPDIVQQVEWVATLDSRTTPICRSRDGKRYPLNNGPRPPAHIRCRSTVIPIMDGIEPPERETYAQWLRRQSEDDQRDILGPTRFRLYREGNLSLDRFVGRDGDPLTLDELRERNPIAFARIGGGG
jgi:SPP1 gp7 family putative phage head morphogenesis protein